MIAYYNFWLVIGDGHYYYYYLTTSVLTPGGSSIHLHTNSTQNAENGTHITITRKKIITREKITITTKTFGSKLGNAGRAPSLRVIPWRLPYS
jgi:hypothetical protein